MRKIILLLSLALFTVHTPSYAKRAYIEYPDNITIKNIEYKASYETGNLIQKAFIVARNIETNEVVCRHSPTCLPAGRLVRGIQTPSPRKRGTIKMNWIPVYTGNPGFRIKCGMTTETL